jgi:phthiodiolone/phenolphthiodiolone dimycocerosates ketoreductase
MLRLTGEYGDGWLPCWPASPAEYGRRRAMVADHAARAGRPEPESGLVIYFLLGESRDRIAEMMEAQPLSKLFALFAVADIWERHGVEHPLGREANGFINTIVHELDPDMLRDLAPRIPVELMDEMMFMGGVDEITERVAGYAAEGLEHIVLGNLTGIVGGMEEVQARIPDFITLAGRLRAL